MTLLDANVLIYACRHDLQEHQFYKDWLAGQLADGEQLGLADVVLCAVVRVTSNPRIFPMPLPVSQPLEFIQALLRRPNVFRIAPGPEHWDIFCRLCVECNVSGNLVTDAYLAAIAMEHGLELVTADQDFAQFPGLRWRHPLG